MLTQDQILKQVGAIPMGESQDVSYQGNAQPQGPSFIDKARNIANATRIPAAGAGIAQGLYDTTKSVADLMPGTSAFGLAGNIAGDKGTTLPKIDLSQYVPQDAITKTAFDAGQIASGIAGDTALYKLAGKIPGLASQRLLPVAARGAAAAYAGGENQPGGRTGAAALGTTLGPLSELGSSSIAKRIVGYSNDLQNELGAAYQSIFKKASDKGIKNVGVPAINEDIIKSFSGNKDVLKSVNKFQDAPTLENAHKAQSDLGKMQREAESSKKFKESRTMDSYKNNIEAIASMRNNIQQSIHHQLQTNGAQDLSDAYQQVNQRYATELAPYFKSSIRDYQKGKTTAPKMLQSLRSNGDFMQNAASNHPDFLRQQLLKKYAKGGAKTVGTASLGAALGLLGLKTLSDNTGGDQ